MKENTVRFAFVPIVGLMLTACGGSSTPNSTDTLNDTSAANVTAPTEVAATKPVAKTTPYPVEACKAAIAAINGREPSTMKGSKIDGGLIHVSYVRPDDGKRWQSRCRIDDANHLTWAAFDAFGDGQQGRWRDEDTVEFTVSNQKMHITVSESGETISDDTYSMTELR